MRTRSLRNAAAMVGLVAMLGAAGTGISGMAIADETPTGPAVDAGQQCTPASQVLVSGASYLVERLGLEEAWTLSRGRGVTVAVAATG